MKPLGSRPRRSYSSGLILAAYLAPGFTTIGNITEADGRRWRADLLDESVSPVTTAKAYRLLKSILATAVEDSLIRRNPCRVKGAGNGESPERPLLTVAEVYSLADACGHRYRAMILLACFGGLRWGELVALRRRDIDIATAAVRISRQLTEARGQAAFFAPPKTAASKRRVILPGSRRLPVTLVPATPRSRQPDRGTRSARLTEARPRASTPGRTVAAMRSAIRAATGCGSDLEVLGGAGDGNRTRMTSLEGWGSAIELRPRYGSRRRLQHTGRSAPGSRRCSAPPTYPPDSPASGRPA